MDRKANNVPLTPGSTTRVLQEAKQKTKTRTTLPQASKQRVPATHISYQTQNKHSRQHKENKSKTPAGERGTSRPTKGGKEIPTAPLLPTSHPPDPRRSREGRAISKRGVGGIPFHNLKTREQDQEEGRKRQTDRAPGPIANHPGPRSAMDLDPGVEMQWARGPRTEHENTGD